MTRVLVVDDEIDTLNLLQTILEISGYQAFTTLNSIDAITLAEVEHPDCILLDIMMPQLDGFTLCKMMRMHPTTKNLPIVFVTAYSALDLEDRRVDAGADMVLPKPIGMDALIEAIEKAQMIRTTKASAGALPATAPASAEPAKVTQPLVSVPAPVIPVAPAAPTMAPLPAPSPVQTPTPSAPIQPVVPAAPAVPAIPMAPANPDALSFEIKPEPAPAAPATEKVADKNPPAADSSGTGDTKRATEPSGITPSTPAPTQPENKKP